ncbi:MAG: hypothetical protein JST80_04195 [Bdellovibrionales bacterium]|nr:hypothetical protein [Bdellovibrionales bacterium]
MRGMISQMLFLALIALVPMALGEAEESAKNTETGAKAEIAKTEAKAAAIPTKKLSSECLASEEIIQDVQSRENKLREREAAIADREKEIESQAKAVHEELAKLETIRAEIQGVHVKEIAEREEKVSKLIETFESMSPKAAAGVINGVDDELAVTALSRLSSVKSGKILSNLSPAKSSKLSELMAYGNKVVSKEKASVESDRAPASSKR